MFEKLQMLLYGGIFGCLSPILSIAAFLSYKSPFVYPKDEVHFFILRTWLIFTWRLSTKSMFGGLFLEAKC